MEECDDGIANSSIDVPRLAAARSAIPRLRRVRLPPRTRATRRPAARPTCAEHLPGAVHADLDHDLAAPATARSGRHPLPAPDAFAARLRAWGVDDDSLLVAYDDANGMWARASGG